MKERSFYNGQKERIPPFSGEFFYEQFLANQKKSRFETTQSILSTDLFISLQLRLYTAEGKQFYQGNLFVPDDLEVIQL